MRCEECGKEFLGRREDTLCDSCYIVRSNRDDAEEGKAAVILSCMILLSIAFFVIYKLCVWVNAFFN